MRSVRGARTSASCSVPGTALPKSGGRASPPSPHGRPGKKSVGQAEVYAALVVQLGGGINIEGGKWDLGRPLLVEDPKRLADDGKVMHFLDVLIAEDQHGGR